MPVSQSRYELLEKRLGRFTRMLHGLEKCDVRALHRTRVASRRLREVIPVLQLEGKATSDLSRRLRKVTHRLGRVRELDVLLLLIRELAETGRYDGPSLDRVGAALALERDRARERLLQKLPVSELKRTASKLDQLAEELDATDGASSRRRSLTRGVRWAVDARVERRAAALKAAIEYAGAVYLPDRLHAVRIALKKLRYALELAYELDQNEKIAAQLRTLKRGQDLLGRWHDRQILIDRVRDVQASLMPATLEEWRRLDGLMTMLEQDCRRLHARYVREAEAITAVCGSRSTGPHEDDRPAEVVALHAGRRR